MALLPFIRGFHKSFLEFDPVQKLLSDKKENFDLVIMEWLFSEVVAGIPPLFQCPFIWIGSTEAHGHILRLIDETPNPAYTADLFSTNAPPFSMWQRVEELYYTIKLHFVNEFKITRSDEALYLRIFKELAASRGVRLPSFDEAKYNASMMLLNSHPSVGTPFKLPQNVKYVGGYHIDKQVKPLPKDLKIILDQAINGAIYFSMGSNLRSSDMTPEMIKSLLKMFENFEEEVIWKFEDDLEDLPKNVHLVKWAPQQSILAHPNLKLFSTHGGQLSTTEAIHFGVPVVGLPVLGDQYINMRSVENKGFGVMLTLTEDFTEELRVAVKEVIQNPKYRNQAKYLSSIYHHRLASPGDELVHWAEHVVKTGGADHLRFPGFMVPWYQKIYLDVVFSIVFMFYMLKSCFKSKSKSLRNKHKRN